ncbi:hypothetical protein BGX21_008687 [Mortierella sp. AD011]|nr:hypothetical protein BGX20_002984 [Mortierella sp. AD010]KAF9402791.1 hypothetical protein BGX21_008687 [Mortierella sp. AD011]
MCAIIRYNIHNLKHLEFMEARRDREIRNIIKACTGATKTITTGNIHGEEGLGGLEIFKARNNSVSQGSIAALIWGHRMTIQRIDIRDCRIVPNNMLEAILRSCPNLIYFQTMAPKSLVSSEVKIGQPYLQVKDTEMEILLLQNRGRSFAVPSSDDRPSLSLRHGWVCKKLKVLTLQYEETMEEVLPKILYHQISQLTCLEELRIACKPSYRYLEDTSQTSTTNMDTIPSIDTLSGSFGVLLDPHDDCQPDRDEGEDKHGKVGGTTLREQRFKILEEGRRHNMREALEMFQKELLHLRELELWGLYPYLDPTQVRQMKLSSQRLRSVRYDRCL